MKKLLIPLLCCLMAAWSCNMEGSYSAKNVQDIVTVVNNQLVSDTGAKYTVTDKAKDVPALEEGKRYYIVFDILNINYDVLVNSAIPVQIVVPAEASAQEEITACDPVMVSFNWIGREYVDLGFSYYYDETSNCAHDVFVRYTLSNGNGALKLDLYHDGNNENPAHMDEKKLKTENRIISIPIYNWDISSVTMTMDFLTQNADGSYSVVRKEYTTSQ